MPVLATKLTPPATRRSVVSRARLLRALDATLEPGHRLTLVSAPAGFGKTTVVAEWCARREVAWVSVDA